MLAFFFAMRSCEYTTVRGTRRTKTIELQDIAFHHKKSRKTFRFDDDRIDSATSVSLTFRDQKNRQKAQTRTAWRTSDDLACPVRAASRIIRRIRESGKKIVDNTLICTFPPGTPKVITATHILNRLRLSGAAIGREKLGYDPKLIGTHSIRSGAAMALVLNGHEAWRVMSTGRWRSSAFLVYIREQVEALSEGVSEDMIQKSDLFQVPDIDELKTSLDAWITAHGTPNASKVDVVGVVGHSSADMPAMKTWG